MNIPYSKQTIHTPNPIARFAHSKRYLFSRRQVMKYLRGGGTLLDFGCGNGDFLNQLSTLRSDIILYGYDPASKHAGKHYTKITDLAGIADHSVDIICCFETLEHLYDHERADFYRIADRLLTNTGKLILSVPIIGGPSLLLKELNRMMLFQRKSDYSLRELFYASFMGVSAKRPENLRPTHKGFDFRKLENELRSNFCFHDKRYTPFSLFPWYLNSQVFFTLSRKTIENRA